MTIASGTKLYSADVVPVTAWAMSYTDAGLDAGLGGSVSRILLDDGYSADVET